jgi:hypothetical protein
MGAMWFSDFNLIVSLTDRQLEIMHVYNLIVTKRSSYSSAGFGKHAYLCSVRTMYSSGALNPGLESSSLLSIFAGERKGSSPWAGARAFKSADRGKHQPDF